MVSASGPIPTGILAERPSGPQNGGAEYGSGDTAAKATATRTTATAKARAAEERARNRHRSDLYVRPSWTDAAIALNQLEKVGIVYFLSL